MGGRALEGPGPTVLAVVLALAACAQTSRPASETAGRPEATSAPASASAAQAASMTPTSTAADVAGQWDVVSFDGYRPQRLSGTGRAAYADFGVKGVGLRLECNYTSRSGSVIDGRFLVESAADPVQTQIGCGPERGPREARYFGFFERNPSVEFVSLHRLRLRAGQDELILERPSVRRLSYLASRAELQGEWDMIGLSWFPPDGGVAGIGLSEAANRIDIAGDRLQVRGCSGVDLTFRYSEQGQLQKSGGAELPAGPLACPGLSDTADGPVLPKASDAIRLLHADPLVEKTGDGALVISNAEHALLLRRRAD